MVIFHLLKKLKVIIKIHPDVLRAQNGIPSVTTELILVLINDTATLKRAEKNWPK